MFDTIRTVDVENCIGRSWTSTAGEVSTERGRIGGIQRSDRTAPVLADLALVFRSVRAVNFLRGRAGSVTSDTTHGRGVFRQLMDGSVGVSGKEISHCRTDVFKYSLDEVTSNDSAKINTSAAASLGKKLIIILFLAHTVNLTESDQFRMCEGDGPFRRVRLE